MGLRFCFLPRSRRCLIRETHFEELRLTEKMVRLDQPLVSQRPEDEAVKSDSNRPSVNQLLWISFPISFTLFPFHPPLIAPRMSQHHPSCPTLTSVPSPPNQNSNFHPKYYRYPSPPLKDTFEAFLIFFNSVSCQALLILPWDTFYHGHLLCRLIWYCLSCTRF